MRILVIGGTHFMGPDVVRRLHEAGHEVVIFHRGRTSIEPTPGVRHILGDRRRLPEYADALRASRPEVVLDMIPMIERDAQDVVRVCAGVARRLVAISSQDVYRAFGRVRRAEPGPPDPVPLTEESPLRETLYLYRGETPRADDDPERWMDDYDKILVERVVMGTPELPATVLRLPAVYGPRDEQHRLREYLTRMDAGRPAILLDAGLAAWRWTRGYVENVAEAIALAVADERAAGRIYNVGEPDALTTRAWVETIARAAGWDGEILVAPREALPASLAPRIDTAQEIVTDTSRMRRELGYAERVPRDEAMRRAVAWERANPPSEAERAAFGSTFDAAAEDAVLAQLRRE